MMDEFTLDEERFHPGRPDRPTIDVPTHRVRSIKASTWKRLVGNTFAARDGAAMIDSETWRDFHNPAIFTWTIWTDHAEKKTTRAKSGKNKGKRITRKIKSTHRRVLIEGWCWDDEVAQVLPPLLVENGIKVAYAHNATVDIIALLSRLEPGLNHPLEYFITEDPEDRSPICFKGSSILAATLDLAPFLPGKYERWAWDHKEKRLAKRNDYPLEIRDSMGLLPMGLAKIGEALADDDFTKGETPEIFKNADHPDFGNYMAITSEMVEYGVQDCRVLWRGLQEFWIVVKDLGYHGKAYPLTIGTLGFQMMADHIAKSDHMRPKIVRKIDRSWKYRAVVNDEWADTLARESLVGGRTQVFDTREHTVRTIGIDARSMYPSAQLGDEIQVGTTTLDRAWPNPTGYMRVAPGNLGADFADYEGAVHVSWKRPGSDRLGVIAQVNDDGLLDWTLDHGTRWITLAQYRYCEALGYDLEVVPWEGLDEEDEPIELVAVLTKALPYCPFEAVESWYEARKEMRARGDPRQILVKLLMNAGGYGKWVEQNQDQLICREQDYVHNYGDDWDFDLVQGPFGYATRQGKKRAKNSAHILGAYITDYARMSLNEMGRHIGIEYLLYTDTDSWKFLDDDSIEIEESLMGANLGQWAVEQIMDYWMAVAPKQYKFHAVEDDGEPCDRWKIKVKGCSLGRLSQDEIEAFDLNGLATFERVVGIRESWRQGGDAGTWIQVEKDIGRGRR
jgi:hypothetical protein